MLKPPKIAWYYRVAALLIAGGMSLYIVDIYSFGAKFGTAVGHFLTPPPTPSAAPEIKSEPGLLPVAILKEDKKPAATPP